MDLATLNAFIAIAELGSFSEAAERLHLTQPAVSKRIASLEQQLNVRLFDRLGREVSLTEAGRALLPRACEDLRAAGFAAATLTTDADASGDVTEGDTLSCRAAAEKLPASTTLTKIAISPSSGSGRLMLTAHKSFDV